MAVADPRALGQTADLFQRAGDSAGVARELDRRGVGQELALAADRAFDQVAEEHTDVAEDQHHDAEYKYAGRAARLFRVARRGGARDTHREVADHRQNQNPVDDADQSEIQPHVAVEDVAELMGHYSLEFLSIEIFEAPAGDGHHGVARLVAGGEGVDARLVVHDVDRRNGDARGQGHLFHDVQQSAFVEVVGLRIDDPAAEHRGDLLASGGKL